MTGTPKDCRSGRKCDPQTLKEALDCLAHHSARSLPEMCERACLDYNRIAKGCSLHDARAPRLDEILALTTVSADDPRDRNVVVLRYVCRQQGGAFIVLPTCDPQSDEFFGAMTAATERLSEMGREIHESLRGDGVIDADEHRKCRVRTQAMHEQIATVEAMVDARARVEGPRRLEVLR